jgi:hypothetical protein
MSVITEFGIKNEYLHILDNIKKLDIIHELLNFQIIIHESIRLLSSISEKIKNISNL